MVAFPANLTSQSGRLTDGDSGLYSAAAARRDYGRDAPLALEPKQRRGQRARPVERKLGDAVKRILDIILALSGLLVSALFWLPIASVIKLGDGGPILHQQQRWGRNGRPFRLYKFRTMAVDSDPAAGITQAAKNDNRVTRVGRALRGTGMDELPQLLNILRGDMSFVGPRPLAIGEVVRDREGRSYLPEDTPGFRERLRVRPGLTGLATISIPKDAPPQLKLTYDLRYIQQRSLWLDVKLIILSLWISVRGRWESRAPKL